MTREDIILYGRRNSILEDLKFRLEKALLSSDKDVNLIVCTDAEKLVEAGIEKIPLATYRNLNFAFSEEKGVESFIRDLTHIAQNRKNMVTKC